MSTRPIFSAGFTLIELIAVLVILGVVSAIGGQFLISTVDSYDRVQNRNKLLNRGRTVLEQVSRQVQNAAPNSVRVSSSGNCVEFLPLRAAARYIGTLPDAENGAPSVSAIATLPFDLDQSDVSHLMVGALSPDEIYTAGTPAGRVGSGSISAGSAIASVPFSAPHRFVRGSVSARIFLAAAPVRFCLTAGELAEIRDYGFSTGALNDVSPGGNSSLMAEDVAAEGRAFTLNLGTENVNASLDVALRFRQSSESVVLQQTVFIRNVP